MPSSLLARLCICSHSSIVFIIIGASGLRTKATHALQHTPASTNAPAATSPSDSTDAVRFNTLGVAYMNQQKFADAQKIFRASPSPPIRNSAIARVNLGVSLLSQQKLDPARAALEQAAQRTPQRSLRLVQPRPRL